MKKICLALMTSLLISGAASVDALTVQAYNETSLQKVAAFMNVNGVPVAASATNSGMAIIDIDDANIDRNSWNGLPFTLTFNLNSDSLQNPGPVLCVPPNGKMVKNALYIAKLNLALGGKGYTCTMNLAS